MSNNHSGNSKDRLRIKNLGSLVPVKPVLDNCNMVTRGVPQWHEQYGSPPTTIRSEFPDNNIASMISTYPLVCVKQETPESYYDVTRFEDHVNENYPEDIKPVMQMDGIHNSNQIKVPTQKCNIDPNDIKTIYKCCNIKFYDKFLHFRHMIDHLEKDLMRVTCSYCNRTFKKEADMVKHTKSMHGGFQCRKCTLRFPKKHLMFYHMKIAHPRKPRKMNDNLHQPKQYQWHKQPKKLANYKTKGYKRFYADPKFSYRKMEIIDSNSESPVTIKTELTNETGLANVKIEPNHSNIKMEPMFFNIKMEPMFVNIKKEPTH